MPTQIYIVVVLLLILGLVFAWMGLRRLFNKHMLSGSTNVLLGAITFLLGISLIAVIANLYTYQQLAGEEAVGSIHFKQYAPQEYVATLVIKSHTPREFSIFGDECQLDARLLKWYNAGTLLGFETLYRFERLSGRYREVDAENTQQRTAYSLAEKAGIELWEMISEYKDWVPWVDAIYGNAVYVPMVNDAIYDLSMTNSGLVARPSNTLAEEAIKSWQ